MFSINPTSCKSNVATFDSVQSKLRQYSAEIESIRSELPMNIRASASIDAALSACAASALNNALGVEKLSAALSAICDTYSKTEEDIVSNLTGEGGTKSYAPSGSDNAVCVSDGGGGGGTVQPGTNTPFDDNGQYGGDQGHPKETDKKDPHFKEMADIIKKYYPNMTDDEIMEYLEKMNKEGCGYVAICNSIFSAYVGNEELFEKTFGFPMYDNQGELNYDLLLCDLYADTDNHHKGLFGSDYKNPFAIFDKGTDEASRKYRTELYLKDKGVDVKIDNDIVFDPQNFDKYSDGSVIMRAEDFKMYDVDGKEYTVKGGHAMTVTGVTEDGRLIVSSWGRKFYLDPAQKGIDIDFAYYEYDIHK